MSLIESMRSIRNLCQFQLISRRKLLISILVAYLIVYSFFKEISFDYIYSSPFSTPTINKVGTRITPMCSIQNDNVKLLFAQTGGIRDVTILFWTKYYGAEGFLDDGTERFDFVKNEYAQGMFDKCQHPANRCRLTNNRSLLQQSQAIIFYARHLGVDLKWPLFRSPEQRWIFFNLESPLYTHHQQQLRNLPPHLRFNWTFTYRWFNIYIYLY